MEPFPQRLAESPKRQRSDDGSDFDGKAKQPHIAGCEVAEAYVDETTPLLVSTPNKNHETKKPKPIVFKIRRYVAIFLRSLTRRKQRDGDNGWKTTMAHVTRKELDNAFKFFDRLERGLVDVLDQAEIREALRAAAVAAAVTEAVAEPSVRPAGRLYGYAVISDTLRGFVSQAESHGHSGAHPFAEIRNELKQFCEERLQPEKTLADLEAEAKRQKLEEEISWWMSLAVTVGAAIAVAFVAAPAVAAVGAATAAIVTQLRMRISKWHDGRKAKLDEIYKVIDDFLETEEESGSSINDYEKLVSKDLEQVRRLAKNLLDRLESLLKEEAQQLATGEAGLKDEIAVFRREQRRFMRTLRLTIKQARYSRKRMRKTAKAVLRELGCARPVASISLSPAMVAPLPPQDTA